MEQPTTDADLQALIDRVNREAVDVAECVAAAADALAESGRGFGNHIMVLGVIEPVALFVMVFALTSLPQG